MNEVKDLKRKFIRAAAIVFAMIFGIPFLLNLRRVYVYEDRVAHILSFKTGDWYLPRSIPDEATNVYYNYSEGWGQGGSSNTLRFRLPDEAARSFKAQVVSRNSSRKKSDLSRPKLVTAGKYEELVWTSSKGNHGAEGGIWYDPGKREFVFYHQNW